MGLNFESWDPRAIACLKYAYDPVLLFMSLLDVQFPFDSDRYSASDVHRFRPEPSKTLIAILERAFPVQLRRLRYDIGVRVWENAEPPNAWGWHEDTESLINLILEGKTSHRIGEEGVCVEDVLAATVLQDPVRTLLEEIDISPGGLSWGIGFTCKARKIGSSHLTVAYVTSESFNFTCMCPWIIGDQLVTGRPDGVVEVLSVPFLRSVWEISLDTVEPVTRISAPVLTRDDAVVAVASGNAIRLITVGERKVAPPIKVRERVHGLALMNASTVAVGTADGLLSIVDMHTGRILRSRKIPGGFASTIVAHSSQDNLSDPDLSILTIDATAVHSWTLRKLRPATNWLLPDPLPRTDTRFPLFVPRVLDALGTTVLAGMNQDMFAVFRERRTKTKNRMADAVIYVPHLGKCTGVCLDGGEALLCGEYLTQILTMPEIPEGGSSERRGSPAFSGRYTVDPYSISITGRPPIQLREELRSGGGEQFATSQGFAQTVVLTNWRQLRLLVRAHNNIIDPEIERAVWHIQEWR
jgi:hypothetical protein